MFVYTGDEDCMDGSDEDNCEPVSCPQDDFPCGQTCVPQDWRCDGRVDCVGGADEENCPSDTGNNTLHTCPPSYVRE